jgi:K+-transporting ATPase c subunit
MLREIRPAVVVLLTLTLITGLVYPLAMTGIAKIMPYHEASLAAEQSNTDFGSGRIVADGEAARTTTTLGEISYADEIAARIHCVFLR